MYTYIELLEKVKNIFENEDFNGKPVNLYEPITYTLSLGGKRIRPVLLLAANDMFGGNSDDVRDAAIGIEVFHNFTLLHDDLMDQSPIRRGKPTVYRKWSPNTAILSGDAMNILAWRYFLKHQHPNLHSILNIFEKTSMEICEGQQYDMDFESRNDVSIPEYMEMIRLKTAVLLAAALKIGALYANAPQQEADKLYNYGIALGLAFQLRDDLLDAYGDTATFGKQTGTDIKDNKKTYLYLLALEKGTEAQRNRLQQLFGIHPDNPTEKINEVLNIYSELQIQTFTQQSINKLHEEAAKTLNSICIPEEQRATLREIDSKLLERNI